MDRPVFRDACAVLACGLIGALAWGVDERLTSLSALFPWALALTTRRRWAFLGALAYYLAGTRCLPSSSLGFFAGGGSWPEAVSQWVGAAALNAAVWAATFARRRAWWEQMLRVVIAVGLLSFPPLGIVGWLNPVLGASLLFAGHGFASLAAGLGVVAMSGLVATGGQSRITGLALTAAATVAILPAVLPASRTPMPPNWLALSTSSGAFPTDEYALTKRLRLIIEQTNAAVRSGVKVLIFPEQYAGQMTTARRAALKGALGAVVLQHQAVVVIGGSWPVTDTSPAVWNALVVFDGVDWRPIKARHAVPIAMWKPFAHDGTLVEWFGNGLVDLNGTLVTTSICMEDYVIWPHLLDMARGNPKAVVAIANQWWAGSSSEPLVQQQHIAAWAAVIGVPLLRSANLPGLDR